MGAFKSILGLPMCFWEVIRDDAREQPIDWRPLVNALIALCSLAYFGVEIWKSAVLAIAVFAAIKFSYATRAVQLLTITLGFTALTAWCELIPVKFGFPQQLTVTLGQQQRS